MSHTTVEMKILRDLLFFDISVAYLQCVDHKQGCLKLSKYQNHYHCERVNEGCIRQFYFLPFVLHLIRKSKKI